MKGSFVFQFEAVRAEVVVEDDPTSSELARLGIFVRAEAVGLEVADVRMCGCSVVEELLP